MPKLSKNQGNILVTLVTVIWGSGFVVSKFLLDNGLSASSIIAIRGSSLSLIMLLIAPKKIFVLSPKNLKIALLISLTNALAFILQTVGLVYTSPSVCAFLTILYIVFVPILSLFLFKKSIKLPVIPAILIAIIGSFILTNMSFTRFSFDLGALICILGALSFAVSITFIGNKATDIAFEPLTFLMGLSQALLSLFYSISYDGFSTATINWSAIILPLLYITVIGTFLTTSAQVLAQKVTDETTVSLIMSLEAVFGAIISIMFGFDSFSVNLLVGGLLIFLGVILATLNYDKIANYFKKINR